MSLESFFSASNPVEDALRSDIIAMVRHKASNAPRSLQTAMGPSETGHPCMRKMAYSLMSVPRCNAEWDPFPSIVGTAVHSWLQEAAEQDNERLGRKRWLIETRVEVTPGLSGSCDLFDQDSGCVIDHKVLGVTSYMAKIKDPGLTYRNQVHQYGRGFKRLGYEVNRVAIAIFPRAGTLSKMHLWSEPYDDARVDEVLARRDAVIGLLDDLDVESNPERYQWIPATPDQCTFCPQWKPEPTNPLQCSGKAA